MTSPDGCRGREARQRVSVISSKNRSRIPEFGRIAAQAAKQVIVQRVREAERAQVVDAFRDRIGELITERRQARRARRGLCSISAATPKPSSLATRPIPRETVRTGDRVRGYLYDVRAEARGPQLFVSRTAPEFMMELFKLEVPEVGQGLVQIKACAAIRAIAPRSPCSRPTRAPIRSVPASACAVRACRRCRTNSMASASTSCSGTTTRRSSSSTRWRRLKCSRSSSTKSKHSMDIAVAEDKLSQAIGRGGQNVRLASKLSGWQLNVMTEAQVRNKSESEQETARQLFMQRLEVDAEIAAILVQEGFSTVEEIAYVPTGELLAVEGFDEDIVEELRARARDALLTEALAVEEDIDEHKPAPDLARRRRHGRGHWPIRSRSTVS